MARKPSDHNADKRNEEYEQTSDKGDQQEETLVCMKAHELRLWPNKKGDQHENIAIRKDAQQKIAAITWSG